uniref:Uncharacterized protein n=1 Tax=mine drainage metagenome TaxID=410659 RepID=E6PPH1_9ZZZZ
MEELRFPDDLIVKVLLKLNTDMVALVNRRRASMWIQWHGVMRHKSAAATMDQTDIRGLITTVHRSVMEAASL